MRSAHVFCGFVVTLTTQQIGAPFIDRVFGTLIEGKSWQGRAIHLSPWRKNESGDRLGGQALCLGRLCK